MAFYSVNDIRNNLLESCREKAENCGRCLVSILTTIFRMPLAVYVSYRTFEDT